MGLLIGIGIGIAIVAIVLAFEWGKYFATKEHLDKPPVIPPPKKDDTIWARDLPKEERARRYAEEQKAMREGRPQPVWDQPVVKPPVVEKPPVIDRGAPGYDPFYD